jgi:hypothetical protein
MRNISAVARAAIENKVNSKPELIISINWGTPYGLRYYGERNFQLGEIIVEGALLSSGQISTSLSAENVAIISAFDCVLDISKDETESILNILDAVQPENKELRVFQYFNSEEFTEDDLIELFYGKIEGDSQITPADKTLKLVASTSSLDTYNVGLKKTAEEAEAASCQWLFQPFSLWTSSRGDEVLINPSSVSPVNETRLAIDNIVGDGEKGYLSVRVRDSSSEDGDLCYKGVTEQTLAVGRYSLDFYMYFFANSDYVSYPESEFLAIALDSEPDFTGDRYLIPLNCSIQKQKWKNRVVRFDLEEEFTFQSVGLVLLKEIPEDYFIHEFNDFPDGSSTPSPNPDSWVDFRLDGVRLCTGTLIEPGLDPTFFFDADDAWPIVFGCVKHVPAIKISSVPLGVTANDFTLFSNLADGGGSFDVTNSAAFPQNTDITIMLEHSTVDGYSRKTVIRGKFTGNTFFLSDPNPPHFQQMLDFDVRVAGTYFENKNYAWLKAGSVFDLTGRLALFDYSNTDQYPDNAVLCIGQVGTRVQLARVGSYNSGLPILEEEVGVEPNTPWTPNPSLLNRTPPALVSPTTGRIILFGLVLATPAQAPSGSLVYGSAPHIELMNRLAQESQQASSSGIASAMGARSRLKDVRNFPLGSWRPRFTRGSYLIPAGTQIFYEQSFSGSKYLCNLYPSYEVVGVSAIKGESFLYDETTNEVAESSTSTRYGLVGGELTAGLASASAVSVIAKTLSKVSNMAGNKTTEINVGELAGVSGGKLNSISGGRLGAPVEKLKKSNIINFNTTGVDNSGQVLKEVPSSLYSVNLSETFGLHQATTISFSTDLKDIEGENWGDDIYVTLRSTLPSNLARVIKWIIDEYVEELEVDETSFANVSTKIQDIPGNFALFGNNNAKELIQNIAWLAKSGVIFDGQTVKLKYLDERPT